MKTAVSIPDRLFKQADRLAKRLGLSRSGLYAEALTRYINGHKPASDITARLNQVYGPGGESSKLDPQLAAYQARKLQEWTEGETW